MASLTKTKLANMAFILIGIETVDDIEDDDEEQAVSATNVFDIVYEECLVATDWYFTVSYQALSKDIPSPTDVNWTYQYGLPAEDFLGDLDVMETTSGCSVPYDVTTDALVLCDYDGVTMKYQKRPSSYNLLAPWFIPYFVGALAAAIAEDLRADPEIINRANQYAESKLARAKVKNTRVGSRRYAKKNSGLVRQRRSQSPYYRRA